MAYRIGVWTGRRDPLFPPPSLHSVGPYECYTSVGDEFCRYFIEFGDLQAGHKVLDVGCGTGRMARPLTHYLKAGSYDGIDIVEPSIIWCQRTYRTKYPNFNFYFSDIYNAMYNPGGQCHASEYRFPFEDARFDFVFLTSVFTHMLPLDMENYLSEVARVLKPGGRCLITYFLLNPDSSALIDAGKAGFSFRHELPGCRIENPEVPEAAVGYDNDWVRRLFGKYGLSLLEPIHYGNWSGRPDGLSWQDIVIAAKTA
ncbi:MAG: methyltransferase domain-containing protein [Methylococcus sp.]|nr:methyltransferase domain-containing protein [Methylococcus sp.]